MTQIFGYLRVSTRAQAESGSSLDTQKNLIVDYIFRQGIDLGDGEIIWEDDAGISASKTRTARRPGWARMLGQAKKGDVIVAATMDRVFRSVGDAVLTMESLKAAGVELHMADRGRVTGGDATTNLQLNVLNSVAQFESELKSKRIKEVKTWMRGNHLWLGGKRKRGYIKKTIEGRAFAVVDPVEKAALQWIAQIKKQRDLMIAELQQSRHKENIRLPKKGEFSIEAIQKTLAKRGEKMGIVNLENRFKRATLFTLLGNDESKNVFARLAAMKENEKKILKVDDEFVLAKDKSSTSRREASIDGGVGQKQMSLMSHGGGLRSREKKEKALSTRKLA